MYFMAHNSPPPHFTFQLTCQSLFISIFVGYAYFPFNSKSFPILNRMYNKPNNSWISFLGMNIFVEFLHGTSREGRPPVFGLNVECVGCEIDHSPKRRKDHL